MFSVMFNMASYLVEHTACIGANIINTTQTLYMLISILPFTGKWIAGWSLSQQWESLWCQHKGECPSVYPSVLNYPSHLKTLTPACLSRKKVECSMECSDPSLTQLLNMLHLHRYASSGSSSQQWQVCLEHWWNFSSLSLSGRSFYPPQSLR